MKEKDYNLTAEVIRDILYRENSYYALRAALEFCRRFKRENKQFDPVFFLKACGFTVEEIEKNTNVPVVK